MTKTGLVGLMEHIESKMERGKQRVIDRNDLVKKKKLKEEAGRINEYLY